MCCESNHPDCYQLLIILTWAYMELMIFRTVIISPRGSKLNYSISLPLWPKTFPVWWTFYSACNARIASAVLATAIPSVYPSVHPSVRLSVTRRYCVKTAAHSTVQFAPLDSKMCLVFRNQKIFPRDDPFPLKFWLKVTYPLLTAASFDTFCLVAPQP